MLGNRHADLYREARRKPPPRTSSSTRPVPPGLLTLVIEQDRPDSSAEPTVLGSIHAASADHRADRIHLPIFRSAMADAEFDDWIQ
jgi:hypothetical protein